MKLLPLTALLCISATPYVEPPFCPGRYVAASILYPHPEQPEIYPSGICDLGEFPEWDHNGAVECK